MYIVIKYPHFLCHLCLHASLRSPTTNALFWINQMQERNSIICYPRRKHNDCFYITKTFVGSDKYERFFQNHVLVPNFGYFTITSYETRCWFHGSNVLLLKLGPTNFCLKVRTQSLSLYFTNRSIELIYTWNMHERPWIFV